MFIVWGKSVKRQKLGFVADYCKVCRDLRTFEVKRVGLASHVYYISFGEGDLQGYERTCQDCRTPFETVPDRYHGMAKKTAPAQELIGETHPNYYTVYREQVELDRKVRDTPSLLTPVERRTRLWEPFAIQASYLQQKQSSLQMDWQVGAAFAALVPIIWLFVTVEQWVRAEDAAEDGRFFLAGLFIGLGIVGWKLIGCGRRYLLKHAVPSLASSIAPLRPTDKELAEVLGQLKVRGLKLGSKLRPEDFLARIEQLRQIA